MNQTYINELKNHIGEEVTLKGWLYNSRSSGKLSFLQLRDGTGIVQCVVFKPNNEELFEKAKALGQESSIIVTGNVKEDTRSAIGVESLLQIVARLAPGITELMCHPGDGSPLDAAYVAERAEELRALCDPRVRATLAAERIELRAFHVDLRAGTPRGPSSASPL